MSNTPSPCDTADPNSSLAKFCNCQLAVKAIQTQLEDYKKRKTQFEADVVAYNASIDANNEWTSKNAYAKGVNPAPYASYTTWLANNPEPVILPLPKAPSFVSDTSTVLCCSQRFNNITVPTSSGGVQFQNVVQQCSTQLGKAIKYLSLQDSSSAGGTTVITQSSTTSGNDSTDISNQFNNGTSSSEVTTTTGAPGIYANSPLWVMVIGGILVVMAVIFGLVKLYEYFSSS